MPDRIPGCPAADVDVIILSWNRVDDTIAAIESTIAQQDVSLNVLIVDQGSEADGLSSLRSYIEPLKNVHLQALECNVGVAAGRNRATAMGRSPYVVALDSDAIFGSERALSGVVAQMRSHQDLGALAFRITNFFTRKNDLTSWDYAAGCRPDHSFQCTRFIGAGHAVRRDLFERLGGYDEALFFCGEELDLCYRILNCGYRIEYHPDAEILHKVSPERRVYWDRGRYFFTVRNNLYTSYKFGVPLSRLAIAAAAFVVRGGFNGVARDALRGAMEAFRLSRRFDCRAAVNLSYRLGPDTWRRIRELEPWREESWTAKIRRQFRPLPNQVSSSTGVRSGV